MLIASCANSSKTTETNATPEKTENKWLTEGFREGMVKDYSSLDGCGFLIVIDHLPEELVLMPTSLGEEFEKNELKIWVKYHTTKPKQTICMKGAPIIIDAIRLRE